MPFFPARPIPLDRGPGKVLNKTRAYVPGGFWGKTVGDTRQLIRERQAEMVDFKMLVFDLFLVIGI